MAQNGNQNSKKTVTGKVDKVVFHDKKSGRAVLSIIREDGKPCRLIGTIQDIEKDNDITAVGSWVKDEKYGWQFMAESIQKASQTDEPVDDGLMHASDFSNVLNKSLKGFRQVKGFCDYSENYDSKPRNVLDDPVYNDDSTLLISGPKKQKSLCVPDSVKCIGDNAFKRSMLESIDIPRSVEHIGEDVFEGCENLISIKVDKDNKNYCDVDGVLYTRDLSQLLYVPHGLTSVRISESTKTIKEGAFSGCNKLKDLSIPGKISIMEGEFLSCYNLSSITIPDFIADGRLSKYFVTESLKSIVLDDSVTHITSGTFKKCYGLQSVKISASIRMIDQEAFADCLRLKTIIAADDNKHFKTIDGVLYDFDVHNIIVVPQGITSICIPETVTGIKNGCFQSFRLLSSIHIPESVTSIEDDAFCDCSSLTSVTIPNSVTSIGIRAFRNCTSLNTVIIPDSVISIGEEAFCGCSSLTHISIPNSVTSIEDDVFFDCSNLEYITIPNSVTSIGIRAFYYCTSLKSVIIPDSVTTIGDCAFFNCDSLENVTIPAGVTKIGVHAFYGCSNLVVNIPATLQNIGQGAFFGCMKKNLLNETISFKWEDVIFKNGSIAVPDKSGGWIEVEDANADISVNSFRGYLAKLAPCLTVHFDSEGVSTIINAKELHDAVITLKIKNDLSSLIKSGYSSNEILERIDGLSQKHIREFLPRDMTPYIKFLFDNHAFDKYPIVPVVEYIGGAQEEGALYTIIIDGQPNIVWENFNDARSTFVFRCTDEDYVETRQRIFDYIMAEETGKRTLLHTNKCTNIFKEKPRMIVHNNLESWSQRLMGEQELESSIL